MIVRNHLVWLDVKLAIAVVCGASLGTANDALRFVYVHVLVSIQP
jgi:hypothetical protein